MSLFTDITSRNIASLKQRLSQGEKVNEKAMGLFPIHAGVLTNNYEIVKLLVENKADVNATDDDELTALDTASNMKNVDKAIIKLLLSYKAVCLENFGNLEFIKTLLSEGYKPTPMNLCTFIVQNEDTPETRAVFKAILQSGVDCNTMVQGTYPICLAAYNMKFNFIPILLQFGCNINSESSQGVSVLFYTIYHGQSEITKYLVKQGANLDAKTSQGFTYREMAAKARMSL